MSKSRDIASRGGLTQVIPTSVSVGSGSATVATNGNISFSSATSISVNGCFSSTYDNYRIVLQYRLTSSAGANGYFQLRSNGTNETGTNYAWAGRRMISWGGASGDLLNNSQTSFPVVEMYSGDLMVSSSIDITSPNKVMYTQTNGSGTVGGTGSGTNYGLGVYGGILRTTAQYDGISFSLTDAATGTIRIYGYNNG